MAAVKASPPSAVPALSPRGQAWLWAYKTRKTHNRSDKFIVKRRNGK